MARFSANEAVGAGFSLIGRKPAAVFLWGLVSVGVVYGPMIPAIGAIIPTYVELTKLSGPAGEAPNVARIMAIEGHLFATLFWIWPLGLIVTAITMAAAFRAVLEPSNRAFAYLRIGMQEVWLSVLLVVEILLALVFVVAAGLVVALVCALAMRVSGQATAVIAGLTSGLAALVLLFWTGLRLTLAAPRTFAERGLRVFESWRLTRGATGQLFLLALLQAAILFGVGMVAQAVQSLPFLFFNPLAVSPDSMRAWFTQPSALETWAPWFACVALIYSTYMGVVRAVMSAPLASAYRALAGAPAD